MASLELHDCMHVLNGLVVHKFVKQEVQDKLKHLALRGDDVWIMSVLPQGRYHMDTRMFLSFVAFAKAACFSTQYARPAVVASLTVHRLIRSIQPLRTIGEQVCAVGG